MSEMPISRQCVYSRASTSTLTALEWQPAQNLNCEPCKRKRGTKQQPTWCTHREWQTSACGRTSEPLQHVASLRPTEHRTSLARRRIPSACAGVRIDDKGRDPPHTIRNTQRDVTSRSTMYCSLTLVRRRTRSSSDQPLASMSARVCG